MNGDGSAGAHAETWAALLDGGRIVDVAPKDRSALRKLAVSAGPVAYKNWRAWLLTEEKALLAGSEHLLSSDGRLHCVGGDVLLGPYALISTDPTHSSDTPFVLRSWWCLETDEFIPSMDTPNSNAYHGGYDSDEMGAVISLATGVRLKTWGRSRYLPSPTDPGRPLAPDTQTRPAFFGLANPPVLPLVAGRRIARATLDQLNSYPRLRPTDAIAVARAARSYQDALWIAESQPPLAWVLLVSAVEAAALAWNGLPARQALDVLRERQRSLSEDLERVCDAGLIERVADVLIGRERPTALFVAFIRRYAVDQPIEPRPPSAAFDFGSNSLRDTMGVVYDARSKALHRGEPFPRPACDGPHEFDGDGEPYAYSETPRSRATAMAGGSWSHAEAPILLHTFEHIARTALLAWWRDAAKIGAAASLGYE